MCLVVHRDSAVFVFLAQISISGGIHSDGKLSDHSMIPFFGTSGVTVSGVVAGMREQLAMRLAAIMSMIIFFIQ